VSGCERLELKVAAFFDVALSGRSPDVAVAIGYLICEIGSQNGLFVRMMTQPGEHQMRIEQRQLTL
jgi:hypothetical protein